MSDPSDKPRRSRAWLVLGVIYAGFFFWYTPLGGPLTEEEIARYEGALRATADSEEGIARWLAFMRSDTGNDFAMFNAIELRDVPEPVEGVPAGATSEDVLRRYTQPFLGRALRNAAHPVMGGAAAADALDLWGIEGARRWDQGALVRYRSRRDVMEQVVTLAELAEQGDDLHRYKIAALEKTIAYPLDPWFQLGDPRLVLALVFITLAFWRDTRRLSRALETRAG